MKDQDLKPYLISYVCLEGTRQEITVWATDETDAKFQLENHLAESHTILLVEEV